MKKLTPIKLATLRGIKGGFYRVKGIRPCGKMRWNVVGPESVAATSLLTAGLVAFNRDTWFTYLTPAGMDVLEDSYR